MKQRFLAAISLVLIFCSILVFPVSAIDITPSEPLDPIDPIDPYVDLAIFSATISINSSGRATCYCYAKTATTTYKVYLSMSLQRYSSGIWQSIAGPWTGSGTRTAYLQKYYYVTPGYYYRTAATATVYTANGSFVEMVTVYSPGEYY